MRLQNYINEITKLSDKEINNILDAGFKEFQKKIKKSKFKPWPIILLYLNISFLPLNINIYTKKGIFSKISRGTKNAAAYALPSGDITIFVDKKDVKKLKNNTKNSKIRKEMFMHLSHELIHRKQFSKMSAEYLKNYKAQSGYEKFEYFSGDIEIEAYAREAIIELKKDTSDIVQTYMVWVKNFDKKIWNKFLKKLYLYISLYGNDKAIQNLKIQLKSVEVKRTIDDVLEYLNILASGDVFDIKDFEKYLRK